ncbi:restriction endonuclease subunit S [Aeromonas sp. 61P]|uniref:restriction endonuclease subunit S n=1 Tax=Aeromonas sp. 61P TaxID=3452721 RepID=UPI003F7901AA
MVPNGWKLVEAKDVCESISVGVVIKPTQYYIEESEGVKAFRSANVREGFINDNDWVYFSHEGHAANKKSQLKAGDILIVRTGYPGTACVVTPEFEGSNAIDIVIARPDREQIISEYLCAYTNSHMGKSQVLDLQGGMAQKHLNVGAYQVLKIKLPPLPEQNKIAQILSTWDKAIITTEQLLANSQQQKKALMQQLLTGKKRLGIPDKSYEFRKTRYGTIPKDWEYPAIKDICTQVTQKNTVSADYPVLSCSKYDGFVDSLKYFKKKVYSDDTSGYRLIHRGCFGFPSNHVEEGSIGLQNLYDTGIVSPIYVVFRAKTKSVDNDYLYAVLKTDHYRQIFGAATNASVDRRGSLRWKEFSLIHVPLPPLDEQQKIAAVLSTADQEISALQQKLDALKQEKKALMQQLLTGKRRVKVEAAA